MANVKISDLPAAVAAQLAMEFEVNDAGTSRRVTAAQIDTLVLGATNGFVARSGTNARVARTLTAGTGVVVSHGNGASGNPIIALSAAVQTSLAAADTAVQPNALVFASLDAAQEGLAEDVFMSPATTAAAIDALVDVNALLRTTQFSTYFMGQS